MYVLNKIVGGCLNPLVVGLVAVAACGVCAYLGRRRSCIGLAAAAIAWFWIWSTPMMYRWLGGSLEREWPVVRAEDAPKADAIVLLGGGMGANTNIYPYAEMWGSADRVWHAVRLYKAGKAPVVIPTGSGERESSVPLLLDFGVPKEAILVEDKARNTEENAKFVERILLGSGGVESGGVRELGREGVVKSDSSTHPLTHSPTSRPKVLLVTSAWHMRRSVLMYKKYAQNLEIIPAPADYEATISTGHPFSVKDLWPDATVFYANSYIFKEYLGYWGYRLVR